MKHVLLATTALAMSAGFASADVSLSGKANAGTSSSNNVTTTSSGIDLNVSASMTTDAGVTLTVADDFGGGSLLDWNDDYRVEAQGSDLDQPSVTVAMGNVTLTVDPGEVSDLYDDSQTGDVQISTSMAGFTIDYVASSDTDVNTNSYKLGYAMGDLSFSVIGTTRGDAAAGAVPAENEAMKWSASYAMGDITLGLAMNNNGDNDDITTGSVKYAMGNGLSVSMSADDNDDWDASVSWSAGAVSVSYSTDENSAYEAHATYDLGGGAKVFAATTDANDFTAFGVEFTF